MHNLQGGWFTVEWFANLWRTGRQLETELGGFRARLRSRATSERKRRSAGEGRKGAISPLIRNGRSGACLGRIRGPYRPDCFARRRKPVSRNDIRWRLIEHRRRRDLFFWCLLRWRWSKPLRRKILGNAAKREVHPFIPLDGSHPTLLPNYRWID